MSPRELPKNTIPLDIGSVASYQTSGPNKPLYVSNGGKLEIDGNNRNADHIKYEMRAQFSP